MNTAEYRSEFASYCSALELAHYRRQAGLERELQLQPILTLCGPLHARRGEVSDARSSGQPLIWKRARGLRLLTVARADFL